MITYPIALSVMFLVLALICTLFAFWYKHKGMETEAESFGAAGAICLLFPLLFALLSINDAKADDWTTSDTLRESAFIALDVADWRQTQDIARHSDREEANSLLGKHPTNAEINRFFLTGMVLQGAIAYILPPNYRHIWQYGGIMLEAVVIGNNKRLGLSVNF